MEALLLYFVFFFPKIYASPGFEAAQAIPFSILRELGHFLTYTLPSLALLWYLIGDKKGFSVLKETAPKKRDIIPFVIGLPGLVIIGLLISFLVSLFSGLPLPPKVEAPASFPGWVVMVFACLGTGYLEETYFRYYLLTKLENIVLRPAGRIIFSTFLFSLCHMYEGPWGLLNAALAGVFLSVLFIRFRSLYGITLAHAGYNIFVYTVGSLL